MKLSYEKEKAFEEKMAAGFFVEKYGDIIVDANSLNPLLDKIHKVFTSNLNTKGQLNDVDIFIWLNLDEEKPSRISITLNERVNSGKSGEYVDRILEILQNNIEWVQATVVSKECEIDLISLERFLKTLSIGDTFENILENIPKLCLIDSITYLSTPGITRMIDELEMILFTELANKKIKVNGKQGILKEVNGPWGKYAFFERGVKKNYVALSLVQKIGAWTIKELSVEPAYRKAKNRR